MRPRLIGITGLAGAGKSTAANLLVSSHGFRRLSLAQPVRDMLAALGVSPRQMSDEKNTPIDWAGGKTPRQMMQTLGTEWGRGMVCQELWVNATRRKVRQFLSEGRAVVIDDVRFDNEAELVRELGGAVVEIIRPGLVRMGHASEAGVRRDLVDLVVCNDGSLEALSGAVLGLPNLTSGRPPLI